MTSNPTGPTSKPAWFKSSYSGGNTTECVECARLDTGILIRDSKCKDGAVLAVTGEAWLALINGLGRGELDGRPQH